MYQPVSYQDINLKSLLYDFSTSLFQVSDDRWPGPNERVSHKGETDKQEYEEGRHSRKGKTKEVNPSAYVHLWAPVCMIELVEKRLVSDSQGI